MCIVQEIESLEAQMELPLNFNNRQKAFTLIEIILVIILVGVLGGVGYNKLGSAIHSSRERATILELEQIKNAIIGNYDPNSIESKKDFGYIAEYGQVPSSWAEIANYMKEDFQNVSKDAWGNDYVISDNPYAITSNTMSYSVIIAPSKAGLVDNTLRIIVQGSNAAPPGNSERTNITVNLTLESGTVISLNPNKNGIVLFSNLPVGYHFLKIAYSSLVFEEEITDRVIVNDEVINFGLYNLNREF